MATPAQVNESLSGIDLTASEYVPFFAIRSDNTAGGNVMIANFGQEGTFAGTETDGGYSDGNGVGDFSTAVISGLFSYFVQPILTNQPSGRTVVLANKLTITSIPCCGLVMVQAKAITGVGFPLTLYG